MLTHLTSVSMILGNGVPDVPAPPPPRALALDLRPVLDPRDFQNKWSQLALSFSQECSLTPQGAASLMNHQSLIRHMQNNYIQCVASGGQPPNHKFFFYGQKAGAAAFYSLRSELLVTKMDVSTTKIHLDTFISRTSNSERREYLVECIVNPASSKAQLKIKADDGATAEAFSTLFQSVLSEFGLS
ncbi:hypothetical protein CFC21_013821 [Triticum aestivum]|uniref:Beta-adaptin appendage C-terminal subdomain domain-containing protein n=2 Tax=Triticum aestivum TaxID=4565 RepID=A0A9R1DT19_WHEAT|nr:hypothetical protein CFC21_013821 [Triticum aestivum]